MTGIRPATQVDIPRIVEMGMRQIEEGAYNDQCRNPEQTKNLLHALLEKQATHLLLYEENGQSVGMLGMMIAPHFYTGEITAHELTWYVEPEYRHSFAAISLLRAAERIARTEGAKRIQFTAPTDDVAKAYEALGYHKLEVTYEKVITCHSEPQQH